MLFIVGIVALDVACSGWLPLPPFADVLLFTFLDFVGATVVIVVTAVVVVIALPLLFFIHVDPASWLLILWPCVNR